MVVLQGTIICLLYAYKVKSKTVGIGKSGKRSLPTAETTIPVFKPIKKSDTSQQDKYVQMINKSQYKALVRALFLHNVTAGQEMCAILFGEVRYLLFNIFY